MVIDSSAMLALLLGESDGSSIAKILASSTETLVMSTVNLTEVLIRVGDRFPESSRILKKQLSSLPIQFIAPDTEQAHLAADARATFPLNLGDCFAYALAKVRGERILTLDRDFLKCDCKLVPISS